MDVSDWDRRHRVKDSQRRRTESLSVLSPAAAVVESASRLTPGKALDLACGSGANALWLAENGWDVTAVDGSPAAIEILLREAEQRGLQIHAQIADLEKLEFAISLSSWDLIVICKYFQADLYAPAILGLAPGGVIVATALLAEAGKHRHRVSPGEFETYFKGLTIIRYTEATHAEPSDSGHMGRKDPEALIPGASRPAMATIVAQSKQVQE